MQGGGKEEEERQHTPSCLSDSEGPLPPSLSYLKSRSTVRTSRRSQAQVHGEGRRGNSPIWEEMSFSPTGTA